MKKQPKKQKDKKELALRKRAHHKASREAAAAPARERQARIEELRGKIAIAYDRIDHPEKRVGLSEANLLSAIEKLEAELATLLGHQIRKAA